MHHVERLAGDCCVAACILTCVEQTTKKAEDWCGHSRKEKGLFVKDTTCKLVYIAFSWVLLCQPTSTLLH